jgi:hypothetical protein
MSAGAGSRRGAVGRSATRCAVVATSRSGCEQSSRRCHSDRGVPRPPDDSARVALPIGNDCPEAVPACAFRRKRHREGSQAPRPVCPILRCIWRLARAVSDHRPLRRFGPRAHRIRRTRVRLVAGRLRVPLRGVGIRAGAGLRSHRLHRCDRLAHRRATGVPSPTQRRADRLAPRRNLGLIRHLLAAVRFTAGSVGRTRPCSEVPCRFGGAVVVPRRRDGAVGRTPRGGDFGCERRHSTDASIIRRAGSGPRCRFVTKEIPRHTGSLLSSASGSS